jgi:hypothetical protein
MAEGEAFEQCTLPVSAHSPVQNSPTLNEDPGRPDGVISGRGLFNSVPGNSVRQVTNDLKTSILDVSIIACPFYFVSILDVSSILDATVNHLIGLIWFICLIWLDRSDSRLPLSLRASWGVTPCGLKESMGESRWPWH